MKLFNYYIGLLFFSLVQFSFAQEVLTVTEAVEIALKNNYNLRIEENNTKISEIEAEVLNSGYLPKVSASSGLNYSNETQNVVFADPTAPAFSDSGLETES